MASKHSPKELIELTTVLVHKQRAIALWHYRPDWVPQTIPEAEQVLKQIISCCARQTYLEAMELLDAIYQLPAKSH